MPALKKDLNIKFFVLTKKKEKWAVRRQLNFRLL